MDAVYTWVDGSGAAFQEALRLHAGPAAGANRFRDNGELRYSLRSLARHAPWVNRIHILTNGQAPRWLDVSHPRIHLVSHSEVFPDAQCLPTFNSHAIEMCLHRIPGLSRLFLYLNDDFFLCRDVRPEDFLTPAGGQVVFLEDLLLATDPANGAVRERACAYTQKLIATRWEGPSTPRLTPAHAPQAYDRDTLFRLESLFADEFRQTAGHRLRSAGDLALNVLYACALLEFPAERGPHCARVLPQRCSEYRFAMLENRYRRTMHHYARIVWERPRFLCINDDLAGAPPGHPLLVSLRAFLSLYYWQPAPWER